MKSQFSGSKCPQCGEVIKTGIEIEKIDGKWAHAVCDKVKEEKPLPPNGGIPVDSKVNETAEKSEIGSRGTFEADPLQAEIDAITKYAEVCSSIGYPKELWNLSTIWNTVTMQTKSGKVVMTRH